jgi:hypothetical protein
VTYGVDQCRVCGKRMKIADPDAARRHQEAIHKKPTMTPKEFKAKGWKSAPTHYQRWRDLDGVCFDCKPIVVNRRKTQRLDRILLGLGCFIGAAFVAMFCIAAFYH